MRIVMNIYVILLNQNSCKRIIDKINIVQLRTLKFIRSIVTIFHCIILVQRKIKNANRQL